MKTPPPLADTTSKETLPDPSQTTTAYPEILPKAVQKVTTPEGDAAKVSL